VEVNTMTRLPLRLALALAIALAMGATMPAGTQVSRRPGVTVRTLVTGAPIHGANGVCFGPDGRLYVASVWGNEILKMDPNSGRILDRIGRDRGVLTPDDLTFGPDGSLYWTSIVTGGVGRLTPEGQHSLLANLGPGVNPITFSPDGEWLYVAKDFLGVGLFKLRPDGSDVTPLLPDLVNFNAFDFGPDGWLYGPLYTDVPKVIRVDVRATPPTVEDVLEGIAPSAVKFDSQHRLVTNDNFTGRVLRYTLETMNPEVLATVPFSMDNLALDDRDRVFVSGDADGYVARILPNGKYVLLQGGGAIFPSGVAVLDRPDGGETVYMGDMWALRAFDGLTGKTLGVEPAGVISAGLTPMPLGLAPDGEARLLVTSPLTYRIQEFDPVSDQVVGTHSGPIIPGPPFMPVHAIRFQGSIVATDGITGMVVRREQDAWVPLSGPGGGKMGLATDGANLWVADYPAGTIFRVTPTGLVPVATGLAGPEGLAFYPPDGSLLVVESDARRLSKIDPATGEVVMLAEGLELGNHLGAMFGAGSDLMIDGVAVGQSGAIYVTGNTTNVLYRITVHP
jgi:sugar lactone lactonase YvrE